MNTVDPSYLGNGDDPVAACRHGRPKKLEPNRSPLADSNGVRGMPGIESRPTGHNTSRTSRRPATLDRQNVAQLIGKQRLEPWSLVPKGMRNAAKLLKSV